MGKFKLSKIAKMYGVSYSAVLKWVNNGLKTETVSVIGEKPYRVIDPEDVKKFRGVK